MRCGDSGPLFSLFFRCVIVDARVGSNMHAIAWIGHLVALAPFGSSNSTQQALMMPTVPRRPQKRGLLHDDKQYNTLTVLVAVLTDYHICCWPTAITTTTDTSQSILHKLHIWFPLRNLHFFFEFMLRSFPSRLHLDSLAAAQVPDYSLDGSDSTSLIYKCKRRAREPVSIICTVYIFVS